jgi:hypothetical protein
MSLRWCALTKPSRPVRISERNEDHSRASPSRTRARRGIKPELGERLALGYQFHIASSREQAIREAAPHYEENMKMFGELRLVRALTDEQIAAMRDPRLVGTVKLPTIEDAVKEGGSWPAGRRTSSSN